MMQGMDHLWMFESPQKGRKAWNDLCKTVPSTLARERKYNSEPKMGKLGGRTARLNINRSTDRNPNTGTWKKR